MCQVPGRVKSGGILRRRHSTATRRVDLLGLRATLFANGARAGCEFSVPIVPLLRRSARLADDTDPHVAAPVSALEPSIADLVRQVASIEWYHTLDLGHGILTPGFMDHRARVEQYRLPDRLDGMRVLDVAAFDGFWSFEFERRGAAEVVALDIPTVREIDLPFREREKMSDEELDRPVAPGFTLAHEVLGSQVKRVHCNVYDLSPERHGMFDLVHCGDLLLHLRDPMRALWNIRRVTRGQALLSDCIFPDLDRHDGLPIVQYDGGHNDNIWWRFGANALRNMIDDAGFARTEEIARFRYGPRGQPAMMWHAVFRGTVA